MADIRYLRPLPLALLAGLLSLWIASWFFSFGYLPDVMGPRKRHAVWCERSSIGCCYHLKFGFGFFKEFYWKRAYWSFDSKAVLGECSVRVWDDAWIVIVPFPVVITAVLPLTLCVLNCRQFRLWHFLAYTTVVAAQLAYYTT